MTRLSQASIEAPESLAAEMPAAQFTHRTLHSFDDAEPYHAAWNELVRRSGADIYQTFEWCRTWWRHYGEGRRINLLLCFSGDDLVGVVPAFTEALWLGPARIRIAKLIGADFSLQLCNLPVMQDALDAVVSHAIRHFIGNGKCDVFLLGPLSGPAARMDEIVNAGRKEYDLVASAVCLGDSISTRFELPENFETYQDLIGSRQRGNYNRSWQQFSKNHKVEADTVMEFADVRREFDAFQSIHEEQWAAENKLGHFGDWPKSAEFNRELVECFGKLGMVRFFRILADGEVACSQYCFRFRETNYWRLPGRACRPGWEKFSLGKMGLIRMIEASLTEGLSVVEGGRGHYDYKVQLGGVEWPLRTIQFTRRGFGVMLRVRLFLACARLLNLLYYKLLFLRLAPKFPLLKHSLWSVWIRSTW